jgi:hypothetical protein
VFEVENPAFWKKENFSQWEVADLPVFFEKADNPAHPRISSEK